MIFNHKKVLVFGTGVSGISAVKLLKDANADITLYDSSPNLDKTRILEKLPRGFTGQLIAGDLPERIIDQVDFLILSPGVPTDLNIIKRMKKMKIPVLGEIELAFAFEKGKVIAITGTNGKTTTTKILGNLLKAYYEDVFVVGNIGIPYTQLVRHTSKSSYTVVEVSSFQLETIQDFRPNISLILNISPDHLDRHQTVENYFNIKTKIRKNQLADDICILNYDDKLLFELSEKLPRQKFYFSSSKSLDNGIYLENDNIIYSKNNSKNLVCNINELKILGIHNYENIMAAVGASILLNVPIALINKVIKDFPGLEHRIEFVRRKNGVSYYNDSKGTNEEASIKAIESMKGPTLLIAGGYDKGSDYVRWINSFDDKVICLVLLVKASTRWQKWLKIRGILML